MTRAMPSALDTAVAATLARLDASAARAGEGATLAFAEARRRIEAAATEARAAAERNGLPLDAPPASASARRDASRAGALATLGALATRLRARGDTAGAQLAEHLDTAASAITRGTSPATPHPFAALDALADALAAGEALAALFPGA